MSDSKDTQPVKMYSNYPKRLSFTEPSTNWTNSWKKPL